MPETAIPTWTLGDRLRKAREGTDLSQDEFARLLGGGTRSTVARYEGDVTKPKLLVVREWARLTGVPEWWLRGSDYPDPGQEFGWIHGADVVDLAEWARRSDWIYVSPDQLTIDGMLDEAA